MLGNNLGKKILIISPHYPPSNLAAVHRSRLFAEHLPLFGWEPIILTVHEDYYEEVLDWNLHALLPGKQRIVKVNAYHITKPRIIGDIGLRAFFQLRKRALKVIRSEQIDFVYIPIPSFYVSLIGRYLNKKTGVKYGIDYIDPWVHVFPGSENVFSRHWFSSKFSKILEPRAVKNASLITGVSEGYYEGVKERNPALLEKCIFGAMPYGGEARDHEFVKKLNLKPYLFQKNNKIQFVYAGAFLPKAYSVLEKIFQSIQGNLNLFDQVEFHFIGTGSQTDDSKSYCIKPLAEKYGLWDTVVKEYPARLPYLDVLIHLESADGALIVGSTESHYTPSKVYQSVLANKFILAVLHSESTACNVIKLTKTGHVLDFKGEQDLLKVRDSFAQVFTDWSSDYKTFDPAKIKFDEFEAYSAKSVTRRLAELLNKAYEK